MKSIKKMALALIAGIVLASCGSNLTPTQVAEKFLTSSFNMDFKEMVTYATSTFKTKLETQLKAFDAPEMKSQMEALKAMTKDVKFEVIDEKIDGDNAVVTVKAKNVPSMGEQEYTLNLVKESGAWKISGEPQMVNEQEVTTEEQETVGNGDTTIVEKTEDTVR